MRNCDQDDKSIVQSFGHLGIMLRNPGYFELCEDPTQQGGVVESICPLNPRAVKVVRDMHREIDVLHYTIHELAYKARLIQAYEQWRGNEKSVDWRSVHHEMIRVRRLFERTFRTTYSPWSFSMARDFRFAADEVWIRERLDVPRRRKTKK